MSRNGLSCISIAAIIVLGLIILSPSPALGGKIYIPEGTEISIKYKTTVSTEQKSEPAAKDIFDIAADLKITGVTAFQKGGRVFCEIIKFKKPGLLGSGGVIEIRIDSVSTALGKNVKVESTSLTNYGKSKKTKALMLLPALGYGLLIKGDHAELGKENETLILKTSELNAISY